MYKIKNYFWCERQIAEPNDQVIWPHLQITLQRRIQMTDYREMQIYGQNHSVQQANTILSFSFEHNGLFKTLSYLLEVQQIFWGPVIWKIQEKSSKTWQRTKGMTEYKSKYIRVLIQTSQLQLSVDQGYSDVKMYFWSNHVKGPRKEKRGLAILCCCPFFCWLSSKSFPK